MYPSDILSTRAVVKPGSYCIIPPTGLVNNVIPGIEGCRVSIVASPKYGASFVQYIIEAAPGGGTTLPFGAEAGVESFLYVIEAEQSLSVSIDGRQEQLRQSGFCFAPAASALQFRNEGDVPCRFLLYKQRYQPLQGHSARVVFGHADEIPFATYAEMENVFLKDLLPSDLGFDMNFHILSFAPGGCHPFVETHVQEHGAYILSGEGAYYLGEEWTMIKQGDFVWFGPFCQQAAYGVGREHFTYVYSKDCNRDVPI